jgi:hypothetical protein
MEPSTLDPRAQPQSYSKALHCGGAKGRDKPAKESDKRGGRYTFGEVLQVFFSVTFMGMGAGQAGVLAPDIAKAKPAMIAIYQLIDRTPSIDVEDQQGDSTTRIQGHIELRVRMLTSA